MTDEINGHEIEHQSKIIYQGSIHTYRCANDGCYIESKGEFNARERIETLAEAFECPSGTAACAICSHAIEPDGDICRQCDVEAATSPRIYDNV